jgi:hypothetical protein
LLCLIPTAKESRCQNIKISPENENYSQDFQTISSPKTGQTENTTHTLVVPALLYGFETWAIREQNKYRVTTVEKKFVSRGAK